MADTTNDIWNDDDGAAEEKKRPHRLRRFLIFFLTLVVVLGIVVVAAWRDGTGFDALHRLLSYGGTETGETVAYRYDASAYNRFAAVGDGLAVLSDTSLRLLDKNGAQLWSAPVQMKAPAMASGGGRAVAYDVGGTELYVLDQRGLVYSLTAQEGRPLIAATLNAEGWLAVTAEQTGYKGAVHVYDERGEDVFEFQSSSRFVTDAYITDDCTTLAAVTLGQEDSVFVSSIVLYDVTQQDPKASYTVTDGLVLGIGQQGDEIVTVSDTCLTLADPAGTVTATYPYASAYLREYDCAASGFTVLLLNRYQAGSVGRLVTVGPDGAELATLDVHEEVLSISAAGRYIAVLYADRLAIYNQDLQEYAALHGTDYAREVLMRTDGTALLAGSEQAGRFLP